MKNQESVETFQSLRKASEKIFELITSHLNVQSAYVAKRGDTAMTVLSSHNNKEELVPEGLEVEYSGAVCRVVINGENNTFNSSNTMGDELTRELEVANDLEMKGFLGVTLRDQKGEIFGTLCVLDQEEKNFSEEDVEFLRSIANILSYLIELDYTQFNMSLLNVPILPITQGVSVLTLQGIVDDERADKLTADVLRYAAQHEIDYFIIELSELVVLNGKFPYVVVEILQALQVMGIIPILTGITPSIAMQESGLDALRNLRIKTVSNVEEALEYIGFSLIESK
ncbi:GAF domain-containing protein [Salimicrobium halophilum]|uniref:RsbT co-antagonist protein RsbR n=1 Tax=Salimicrobium halophilum TaxID=86666 RepID=A0A1G8SXC9_9BACI|nr:GAF domain-containing protein [Salimicrobium halophilum]SDJ33395.1 rsbT co-antagonist protein RsbR [Salimicrobium halophilum]